MAEVLPAREAKIKVNFDAESAGGNGEALRTIADMRMWGAMRANTSLAGVHLTPDPELVEITLPVCASMHKTEYEKLNR